MRYQIEYCPNPDCLQIHTDQRLIRGTIATFEYFDLGEGAEKDFRRDAGNDNADPLISFCRVTTELDGMEEHISFGRYQIQMMKAPLFLWERLLPHILCALRTFVAKDGSQFEELMPAKRPTPEYLEALRKQGCEV